MTSTRSLFKPAPTSTAPHVSLAETQSSLASLINTMFPVFGSGTEASDQTKALIFQSMVTGFSCV